MPRIDAGGPLGEGFRVLTGQTIERPVPLTALDELVIGGVKGSVALGDSVQDVQITRSIEMPPSVVIRVTDPSGVILSSPLWDEKTALTFLGSDHRYILRKTGKAGAMRTFTLTFEDGVVNLLRSFDDPRKAYRDKITRLVFVQSLCREAGVKFYAPEAGPPTPSLVPNFQASASSTAAAGSGFDSTAKIYYQSRTGNGGWTRTIASKDQKDNMAIALQAALSVGAPEQALVAIIMTGAMEDSWRNAGSGGRRDDQHYGVYQQSPRYYTGLTQIEIATKEFLLGSKKNTPIYNGQGFLRLLAQNASMGQTGDGLARLIQRRQNPQAPNDPGYISGYRVQYDDAVQTVAAFSRPGKHTARLYDDRFEWSRGEPGNPETSWDAIKRIMGEIGWRVFVVGDTVWSVSDDWLSATPSRATLVEGRGAVGRIDWEIDSAKATAKIIGGKPYLLYDTCRVQVDASWVAVPGLPVTIAGQGPANGVWLIGQWTRSIGKPDGTLELVRPAQSLPEPVGDQSGKGPPKVDRSSVPFPTSITPQGRTVRERIVSYARWGVQNNAQIHWQEVRPIDGLATPLRLPSTTDCSGFVTKAYKAAGAPDPNGNGYSGQGYTGTLLAHLTHIPRGAAQIGDLVVYGAGNGKHVVVLTSEGPDPLCVSHGQESGPSELRLSTESAYHKLEPLTFLDGGVR